MTARFTDEHLEAWRRDGGTVIPSFFTPQEVAAVCADFEVVFGRASGATVAVGYRASNQPQAV